MNLAKMFEMQRALGKVGLFNYQGDDRFEKLVLALLVELAECANEWRGFKFWSKDQEPRNKAKCPNCRGKGFNEYFDAFEMFEPQYSTESCNDCEGTGFEKSKNPLLEEYVDGLHFVLELGLEREKTTLTVPYDKGWIIKEETITKQFNVLFDVIGNFSKYRTVGNYADILDLYIGLGEMLGFTWEQIEQAYYEKNKVNHKRQEQGY